MLFQYSPAAYLELELNGTAYLIYLGVRYLVQKLSSGRDAYVCQRKVPHQTSAHRGFGARHCGRPPVSLQHLGSGVGEEPNVKAESSNTSTVPLPKKDRAP